MISLRNGDCLEELKRMLPNSVDSLVTDPPAGIAFMGKDWDKDKGGRDEWIKWMTEVMEQCHRVMKDGAHGFVWAIPRTSHWTATALESAGFEVRDVVTHLFGSGFPKSHNISKAIDKKFGAERKKIGENKNHRKLTRTNTMCGQPHVGSGEVTAPSTSKAKQWDGWGTALKPASEHWILVRKPFKGTVADNVLKHGTGGINIDGCRIDLGGKPNPSIARYKSTPQKGNNGWEHKNGGANFNAESSNKGRFPANVILDEEAARILDEQSGISTSSGGAALGFFNNSTKNNNMGNGKRDAVTPKKNMGKGDTGGASRFFYCAKASKSERGKDNSHPTVKAQKLMRYLVKMVTPPEGVVLDPFMGSGSTGVAATSLGFRFIGIEQSAEYFSIARARIDDSSSTGKV